VKLSGLTLRQRDGITCGPAVAVVAGALLDPGRSATLSDPAWFADQQSKVHAGMNKVWPRRLGTTPSGMAHALSARAPGVRYRWRPFYGRRDELVDVGAAVAAGWPVAMLIGRLIPRHWVLILEAAGLQWQCYEPSSGEVRTVATAAVRRSRLIGLGYPRAFAFVRPQASTAIHSNV
jgi:hypothetical protein